MAILAGDLLLPFAFSQLSEGNYQTEQQVAIDEHELSHRNEKYGGWASL